MKNTFYLMIVVLFLSCCTGKREKSNECQKVSTMTLLENVSHVMADTTATPKEVYDAIIPMAERLSDMAMSDDKQVRINVQGLTQELLMDIVFKFENLTEEELEERHNVLDLLGNILNIWVPIKGPDGAISLTKEIVYVSYQDSDERKEGFFSLQITPPQSSDHEPYVKVTFPSTAVDAPALMFGRYKSPESTEEDRDSWELVEFDQWWGKDQLGEGVPLMASGRNDILEKMLSYDILYISFISEDLSERTPGGYEIARVHLKSFKEAYLKHQQDNISRF